MLGGTYRRDQRELERKPGGSGWGGQIRELSHGERLTPSHPSKGAGDLLTPTSLRYWVNCAQNRSLNSLLSRVTDKGQTSTERCGSWSPAVGAPRNQYESRSGRETRDTRR